MAGLANMALETKIQERGYGISLHERKTTGAGFVSGVSLNKGLENPLCETVKVKPGLPWRLQDVGYARSLGYQLRKTANREWSQPNTTVL